MKKIVLSMIVLVFSLTLLACGKDSDDAESIDFEFHVFRNSGVETHGDPTRIMNPIKLGDYITEHGISGGEFYDFVSKHYTTDFFIENYIVFVTVVGSAGESFVVENVKSNGNIYITRRQAIFPNIEIYVIIIELPKTFVPTTFNVKLNIV